MADMMPADQAAKVLRAFNEWRRSTDMSGGMPDPAIVGHALDAAVAALEAVAGAEPYHQVDHADPYSGGTWYCRVPQGTKLYTAPQPAYCCAKCGMADVKTQAADHIVDANKMIHQRESALAQDAERGNFRHPKNNDHQSDGA